MIKYKLIIIDGNNLATVSHFAYQNLKADVGKEIIRTGCVFGFFDKLLQLKTENLSEEGRILIAWDLGYGKRKEIYSEYKQNRVVKKEEEKEEYNSLFEQMQIIKKLLKLTVFFSATIENQEADDVIAVLVGMNKKAGKILIVSGDNDLNQLISKDVHQMQIGYQKRILYFDNFEEIRKIKVEDVVLSKMFQGDSSDNIKGLEKVGKVTSKKFLDNISDEEKMNMLEGNIFVPEIIKQWALKKNIMLDEIKRILFLNWQLIKLDGSMKGLKIQKGKSNSEKLQYEFERLEMEEFLKPNNFRKLV